MFKIKRGEAKNKTDFGVPELYEFYKNHSDNFIPRKVFRELLSEYNTEILRLIVYDGLDYSMNHRIGSLRIKKMDNSLRLGKDGEVANKLMVNWPKTHKLWSDKYPGKTFEEVKKIPDKPLVYHLNEHSDGYVFKWYWDKFTSNLKNQSAYRFRAIRNVRREAAQAWKTIPELKELYYE